jgi:hypothetical protein
MGLTVRAIEFLSETLVRTRAATRLGFCHDLMLAIGTAVAGGDEFEEHCERLGATAEGKDPELAGYTHVDDFLAKG